MKKTNENLESQNYGDIFDQNHPSIIEAYDDGDMFLPLIKPELKNHEVREQTEAERLQRRESFIKLAKAAIGFKSPVKVSTEKSAQNDRELQIAIAESLAGQTDSDQKFNKIVGIFESDCIPNFAKHFLSFNIIHPNPKEEFIDKTSAAETPYTKDELMKPTGNFMDFGVNTMGRLSLQGIKSPTLKFLLENNVNEKIGNRIIPSYQLLIYDDLLKCELGSSGRLVKKFVQDIRHGEDLMHGIMNGDLDIDKDVNHENRVFLDSLITQLESLYSQINHDEDNDSHRGLGLGARIADIIQKIKPTNRYDLSDRLVRMFFYFNGIKSADDLLQIIESKREYADRKNREAKEHLTLNENDLIKLIKPETLPTVLENGILAKEYLGVGAKSDYTPMDTDFYGYIKPDDDDDFKRGIDISTGLDLENSYRSDIIEYLGVSKDNFCMLIVRNDDRFKETKGDEQCLDKNKYEVFFQGIFLEGDDEFLVGYKDYEKAKEEWFEEGWGKRDFGVRTGLPSSEIDAIVVPNNEKGKEIINAVCNNPFYIPIYDADGNMILSPKEYDEAHIEES